MHLKTIGEKKEGIEINAAAFTDHMAVLVGINLMIPFIHRGKRRWYMNTSLIDDPHFRDNIKMEWSEWKKHIRRYPSIVHWWEHHVKRKVKYIFVHEGTERKSDRNRMGNFIMWPFTTC